MATEEEKGLKGNGSERFVEIRNFRNIGITKSERLVLNRSAVEGKMGDLVFLIGPNNSGKSNVLDAVAALSEGTSKGDVPERGAIGEEPEIHMYLRGGATEKESQDAAPRRSALGGYLSAVCQDEFEAEAIERFVMSGRYNFSDTLDHRFTQDLAGKTRRELVKLLNDYADNEGPVSDSRSIACRLLVTRIDDIPVPDHAPAPGQPRRPAPGPRPNAPPRPLITEDIPDAFSTYVSFERATVEMDAVLEVLMNLPLDKKECLSLERFARNSYLCGNLGGISKTNSLRQTISSSGAPRRVNNIVANLKTLILRGGASPEEETLAFRLLYLYASHFGEPGWGIDDRDPLQIVKSVSFLDPLSKPRAKQGAGFDTSQRSRVKIVRYVPNLDHKDSELNIRFGSYGSPAMGLLSHVGITPEYVEGKLDEVKRLGNHPRLFRDMEDEMLRRMGPVNEQFNRLYGCRAGEYVIEPFVVDGAIDIRMSKGSVPIRLDNQSTGFKWFFDFFLSVICGDGLDHGDIVLMDEPATNLHVRGQTELREVMKRFAVENQVTFVISTHSPFLVSCDYLDEVRIISRGEDGFVRIENNFQAFGDGDGPDESADQLDGVLSALTVGRYVMRDPGAPLVFVEGITDYNYLTAFAKLLGEDWVSFMPINGLKNDNLGRKLRRIDRNPVILVDSDVAGYIAKAKYGGRSTAPGERVRVVTLEDVDPSFVGGYTFSDFNRNSKDEHGFTVEDLFTEKDRREILEGRKESDFSSVFKSYIGEYGTMVSEETKDNFAKVFGYLRKEFMEGRRRTGAPAPLGADALSPRSS